MRAPGQSIDKAAELSSAFIEHQLRYARRLQADYDKYAQKKDRGKLSPGALSAFGLALHAVQDMTSPAHEGYQQWNDSVFNTPSHVWHFLNEALPVTLGAYRQGFAVGASQQLFAAAFGRQALQKATGGIDFGGANDPTAQEIRRRSEAAGGSPAEEEEALYEYRLGLTRGWNFNYNDQRQHRPQGMRR